MFCCQILIYFVVFGVCVVFGLLVYVQVIDVLVLVSEEKLQEVGVVLSLVIVMGLWINVKGFIQFMLMMCIDVVDMEKVVKFNFFNVFVELFVLQGSIGCIISINSISSGIQGLSLLSLCGLQFICMLMLLDGQCVVGVNVIGVIDVSQFLQLFIKQVDVVIGGVLVFYGLDVVGGVVNFVIDKCFIGFKVNVEVGEMNYYDDCNIMLQVVWGNVFVDGWVYLQVSVEYSREKGVFLLCFGGVGVNGCIWFKNLVFQVCFIVSINDGKLQYIVIENV